MSFKLIDHEQGSDDWLKWRRFKIGASEIAAIVGDCPYSTPLQLWEKKIEGTQTEKNEAMRRGHELEPIALAWANKELGTSYLPISVESIKHQHLIASLDGYDPSASTPIIEIKCMSKHLHEKSTEGIIPLHYQWQIQQQMFVMEVDKAWFLSYQPGDEMLIECKSNEEMQHQIEIQSKLFYDRIMNFDPPTPCDRDIFTIDNSSLIVLMDEYTALESASKAHQNRMKEIKDTITAKLTSCSIKRANIGSKRVSLIPMKGRVDYDAIPELKGLDLDKYRTAPTSQWRIMNYSVTN